MKPPPPPLPQNDEGKKGGRKQWGELTVAVLVVSIFGWLLTQNSKLYDEISKLREENQKLNDRVLLLENKNFVLKSDLVQSTVTKEDLVKLAGDFASKNDLSQTNIRVTNMIGQLGLWAQDNFAEICFAVQGTFTSDNICKINGGGRQQQIIFHPMNLEPKK